MDIKLAMNSTTHFLCNFSSFFSYVRGIPVTNHFSLLLIDRYILVKYQQYGPCFQTIFPFLMTMVIPKLTSASLCKPVHNVRVISVSSDPLRLEAVERKGKNTKN